MIRTNEIQDLLVCDRLRDLEFSWVDGARVELPYRELLCHDHDMTSTLSRFHGGEVLLEIFEEREEPACYLREVLLRVGAKPVEYGLIRIFLENFPEELRSLIVAGKQPLGAILNESGLGYASRPGGFLKIPGETFKPDFFPPSGGGFLFGRYNQLIGSDQKVLARIIEILPREKP